MKKRGRRIKRKAREIAVPIKHWSHSSLMSYLRNVADFEINFGRFKSKREKKKKRENMEREYLQAIAFYLEKAPKYNVLGVEVKATAEVPGLPLPLKAVSDLV